MKIFRGEAVDGRVAESVKIGMYIYVYQYFISYLFTHLFTFFSGDPLTMVISIDHQDIYGMHVSECYVRDGLGWSDQGLINDEG